MTKKIINLKGKSEEEARKEFMKVSSEIWDENPGIEEMTYKPLGNNKVEVIYG